LPNKSFSGFEGERGQFFISVFFNGSHHPRGAFGMGLTSFVSLAWAHGKAGYVKFVRNEKLKKVRTGHLSIGG
jgi:hypothetical protein